VLRRPLESALAALIGVEDHPGHVPTADRDRDTQGGAGQRSVVVGVEREPHAPARVQVEHHREIQLAFVGGDLGQIPTPAQVGLAGRGEVALERVRGLASRLVRTGGRPAPTFSACHQPLLGH
jgi:hypothetical protein